MEFYTQVSRVGNNICFRGYRDGKRISFREPFYPTLYRTTNSESKWMTIDGRPVKPVQMSSMKAATAELNTASDVSNMELLGNSNFGAQWIQERYPNDIEFNYKDVKIATMDIEVESDDGFPEPERAEKMVQSIALKYVHSKLIYVWTLQDNYDPAKTVLDVNPADIINFVCADEEELLIKFIAFWSDKEHSPDILTGWNTRGFDIPYLINRTFNTIGADYVKKFSPWGMVRAKEIGMMKKKTQVYEMVGIEQLDYYDLFQKFGIYSYGVQESYRLDHIANVVLGERKLSYEEHGNLFTLYKEDYQKFIDYNIKDVLLVERLEEKMGLVELAMTIAYKGGCNYQEAFGTTQLWDTYIYRELSRQNKVVPTKVNRPNMEIAGGYVKTPEIGRHSWIVSFDLNSLYPHLMMQYNMSPETVMDRRTAQVSVEKCLAREKPKSILPDCAIAANGVHFRKDERGVIPSIIDKLYAERKDIKINMLKSQSEVEAGVAGAEKNITRLNTQQMAIKIMMNSLYGAMGNKWFRYYDVRVAEAITLSGQLSVRWAEKTANDYMNKILGTNNKDYVVAIDTDSLYMNFGPMVEQMGLTDKAKITQVIDSVTKNKFVPLFADSYAELGEYMNAYENRMVMDREVIADAGIWTAKKRYILNVLNSEGVQYTKPKLKIMGIEAVKSSTPASCRGALKELFNILITGTEKDTQKAIKLFREHFNTLSPHEIAFPRGVSEVTKWKDPDLLYKSGCPIHVRGSLIYNKLLHDQKLERKYSLIKDGEKIKFVYLNPKNRTKENIIAFPDFLPKEFELDGSVDYQLQFDKAFLAVVRPVLTAIGWKEEESVSLEDFFG